MYPRDQLSHLEDVFDEPVEDSEEVVEDRLVQTWTEDDVRLQQLHLGKEERLRRLLLFRLKKKQVKVMVASCTWSRRYPRETATARSRHLETMSSMYLRKVATKSASPEIGTPLLLLPNTVPSKKAFILCKQSCHQLACCFNLDENMSQRLLKT